MYQVPRAPDISKQYFFFFTFPSFMKNMFSSVFSSSTLHPSPAVFHLSSPSCLQPPVRHFRLLPASASPSSSPCCAFIRMGMDKPVGST